MTYKEFIDNILIKRNRFLLTTDGYHERHHILPKSCGGTNDKENLIDLYAHEHFIVHKLLAQENPDNINLVRAYNIMAFTNNNNQKRYELSPEEYEEARKMFSENLKKFYQNKENHPCYGKHLSEERKQYIGAINKGNKYCVGRVLSEETKRKIGDANRNPSLETRQKMSKARKGKRLRGENSNAKKVIRLSDGKIYDCMKDAAEDNNINYSTFKSKIAKGKEFVLYVKDINKD